VSSIPSPNLETLVSDNAQVPKAEQTMESTSAPAAASTDKTTSTEAPILDTSTKKLTSSQFHDSYSTNFALKKTQYMVHLGFLNTEILDHNFTKQLEASLSKWDEECKREKGYPLLMDVRLPNFNRKSYESVIEKIYRTCYVFNKNYPNAPTTGWITTQNYLSSINDLVRNKISCKFIDGPQIIAQKLKELANTLGLRSEYFSRNYDDGYYAYHFYVYIPVEIDDGTPAAGKHEIAVEIQISTQLKEVMYEILHKFYANERSKSFSDDWKWQVGSAKFKSGYLSHTLHMLEGMIVELRDDV
jgi:ppGpp synthetase/RelA/SpoT-type nucleotidyltranferase